MDKTALNTEDPPGESGLREGEVPAAGADHGMDDADAFIVERIAEAVVRKIDEREKINLLAEAVLERMRELNGNALAGGSENGSNAPDAKANDGLKEPTAQKGGRENVEP